MEHQVSGKLMALMGIPCGEIKEIITVSVDATPQHSSRDFKSLRSRTCVLIPTPSSAFLLLKAETKVSEVLSVLVQSAGQKKKKAKERLYDVWPTFRGPLTPLCACSIPPALRRSSHKQVCVCVCVCVNHLILTTGAHTHTHTHTHKETHCMHV